MAACSVSISELRVFREDVLSGERRRVLDDVSFSIEPGERLALVGPNGAGKSSLLLALVGALPIEGVIRISGDEVSKKNLVTLRRRIGFVFAEPADQLFSSSALDEVAFGPLQRGMPEGDAEQRARAALAEVGLEAFAGRAPGSLSLGEQRRLAIATALASEPELLLLDEPTASLDGRARRAVLEAIRRCQATLVIATHDLEAAEELDARVALFNEGRLIATAPVREALRDTRLLDRAGLDPPPRRAHHE